MREDPDQLPRVVLSTDEYVPEPRVGAGTRFLLRLAAIAWPFGSLWLSFRWTVWPETPTGVPVGAGTLLVIVSLGGTAMIVRAVGAAGRRQRRALVGVAALAVAWVLAALLTWLAPQPLVTVGAAVVVPLRGSPGA